MATKFKNIIGLTLCLITFAITINSCCGEGQQKRNLTIVVSLDAFRWDYPTIYNTPWLDSIAANGVAATMVPSYPSSTFPNHFTLATDSSGRLRRENSSLWEIAQPATIPTTLAASQYG